MRIRLSLIIFLIFSLLLSGCGLGAKKNMASGPAEEMTEAKAPKKLDREPVLKVYMTDTGQIKSMPLEKYLAGVVAGEMKNDWPTQALAAQAVLARTFTMEIMARKKGQFKNGADISTDIHEAQAYSARDVNDKVLKAVKMTRGEVALYQDRYIHGWYFSSAGGITATAKEGLDYKWPEPEYIKVVKTPEEEKTVPREKKSWTAVFTLQQVASAAEKLTGKRVGHLQEVKISKKGPSGRAYLLTLKGSDRTVTVKAPELRIALGSKKMKSTLLTKIKTAGGKVKISGRGFGHGVGMSQFGAYGLAKQNRDYKYILKHYFNGVTVKKLYN